MKHLEVEYSNGEKDFWSIPEHENLIASIHNIERETGLTVVNYTKVRGYED
jgi:hypothetical protein